MRTVRDMARRYSDILIDAGAGDTREVDSALRVAETVIIPVQPAGLDVWTLGLMDDRVGEAHATNATVMAYVVLKPGRQGSEGLAEELRQHVKSHLAPYKFPRWVEFLDELPKGPTGKILKREIEAPAEVKAAT